MCNLFKSELNVCLAVPPHMLEKIEQNGDAAMKKMARNAMITSARMQGFREAIGPFAIFAQTGSGTKRRTTFDAKQRQDLPGKLARGEGDPKVKDTAIDEAHDGAGAVYDFMFKDWKRNSIDDKGMRLDSTCHFGKNWPNAMWEGRQMAYGDGDRRIFARFTADIAVIAHEFAHGVTQATCGLVYFDDHGALNEHFSDVAGILVKQRVTGKNAKNSDWLIGAGLLMPGINGAALRSMAAPGSAYNDRLLGSDPQPGHMSQYKRMDEDNGGVHINSGIPNKAFYEASMKFGDSFVMGNIWYRTWVELMKSRSTFKDCAAFTVLTARKLHGNKSPEANAVLHGWQAVGISPQV